MRAHGLTQGMECSQNDACSLKGFSCSEVGDCKDTCKVALPGTAREPGLTAAASSVVDRTLSSEGLWRGAGGGPQGRTVGKDESRGFCGSSLNEAWPRAGRNTGFSPSFLPDEHTDTQTGLQGRFQQLPNRILFLTE